jgi:hypothetical protein
MEKLKKLKIISSFFPLTFRILHNSIVFVNFFFDENWIARKKPVKKLYKSMMMENLLFFNFLVRNGERKTRFSRWFFSRRGEKEQSFVIRLSHICIHFYQVRSFFSTNWLVKQKLVDLWEFSPWWPFWAHDGLLFGGWFFFPSSVCGRLVWRPPMQHDKFIK